MPPFPELKDITPPTAPPFSSPLEVQELVTLVFLSVVGVAVLAALAWWFVRRAKRLKMPPLPLSAATEARRGLEALRSLAGTLPAAEFGQRTSDLVRRYLQREHGLLARYRTTEELFGTSGRADAPPPLPHVRGFEPVLQGADALKFAGPAASTADLGSLVDQALAAIHYAEEKITLSSAPGASAPPQHESPSLPQAPVAPPALPVAEIIATTPREILPPGPPPPPANAPRPSDFPTLGAASSHVIP